MTFNLKVKIKTNYFKRKKKKFMLKLLTKKFNIKKTKKNIFLINQIYVPSFNENMRV